MASITIPVEQVTKFSDDVKSLTQKASEIPSSKSIIPQTEFSDAELKKTLKFWEVTAMDDATMVTQWSGVQSALAGGTFSAQNLKELCQLAFNLRKPHEPGHVFIHNIPDSWKAYLEAATPDGTAIPATENESTMSTIGAAAATGSADETAPNKAAAIAFLSCTLMRLAIKEPKHIMDAMTNIRSRYGSLYGRSSPFLNSVTFNLSQLSRIKQGLETYAVARGTLFYYTRHADSTYTYTTPSYGICRYLLFQHLELEGMHIYKMLLALQTEWATVPMRLLLTWIRNPRSKLAVLEIVKILTNWDKANVDKGWKYARLVNNTFFLNLSSRRNTYLCAVLAALNKKFVPQGTGDYVNPNNIAVIKNMDSAVKKQVSTDVQIVERIYDIFLDSSGSDDAGTAFTLSRGVKRTSTQQSRDENAMDTDTGAGEGSGEPKAKKGKQNPGGQL
uniref:Nucleoprotein n=1 Tax=maize Iranian mosaic virus TaxID=348823 RepID=A0A3G2LYV2_9RHAB|nr:nucleocapsid protein [maize Iranian mosaic virus]